MEPEFWKTRWAEGRIGFHEGQPNALLAAHVGVLGEGRRVLVPLAGKTEDMAFLRARGHEVVGVELVESAARAFFEEHGLSPTATTTEHALVLRAEGVTIVVGDFFRTTRDELGPVNALYDRAAIVALPPPMRSAYVEHLRALLPSGSPALVITFEYPQERMPGPPFCVDEREVRTLYDNAHIELLASRDATGPRFSSEGITAREIAFAITIAGSPGASS